jgi:hypothetical protein
MSWESGGQPPLAEVVDWSVSSKAVRPTDVGQLYVYAPG